MAGNQLVECHECHELYHQVKMLTIITLKHCLNGPFPFYVKFEKIKNGQKFHNSVKEHPMFSKIVKFGCEML